MKKLFLLTILAINLNLCAQHEVFSEAIQPNLPFALTIVEENIYVTVFSSNSSVQKIDLNNPATAELVADFPNVGAGPWRIAYHEPSNSLYVYTLYNAFIQKIDLNQNLPITAEEIVGLAQGVAGMEFVGDLLYLLSNNSIYTLDVNVGGGSLTPYYIDSNTNLEFYNPVIYNDEIYFSEKITNNPDLSLVKIPINDPSPTKMLVSTLDGFNGVIQSSLIVQNNMYLGLETSGDNMILKVNLDDSIPIEASTVVTDLEGGPLGLAFYDGTFYASEGSNYTIVSFIDPDLNIDNQNIFDCRIYPNPSSEKIFIENMNTDLINYSIVDVQGKEVKKGEYLEDGINISIFENGIYFLYISKGEKTETLKFIKN